MFERKNLLKVTVLLKGTQVIVRTHCISVTADHVKNVKTSFKR